MPEQLTIPQETLQGEIDRVQRELSVLYDVSNAMRTTLELDQILYIILTGVTAHTGLGFNRAVLFLVNSQKRCLEPRMAIGPESGEHAQQIWGYVSESTRHIDDLVKQEKLDQKIDNAQNSSLFQSLKHLQIPLMPGNEILLAKAYHEGKPMVVHQDQISQYAHNPFLQAFHTQELVIMPLKAKDMVNGLIVADNAYTRKPITPQDLKIFTMLANQAGLAIENSRLYEMVMHRSHTDSGTGLWNHGFFQNQLSKEIEERPFQNEHVSVILMDIDNFKTLNDTCGHQNGDLVLNEIAKLLKDSSRDIDFACRYGGEEFGLILPQTSKEQALAIAERIRQRIEQYNFSEFVLNPDIKVTVSVGVATLPLDASTREELIRKADKSMYAAKFGGKNQTRAA